MDTQERFDWRYMLSDTRARVYLLWAFLASGGFLATHYHQAKNINVVWFLLVLAGLGYMLKVMPLRIKRLKLIYLSWLVPITFGLLVSHFVFSVEAWFSLLGYLGGFWLLVMAVGYFLNGLVDPPSLWYWLAAGLNLTAGLAVFVVNDLLPVQYLLAAIVSAWSMLSLWVFRVD